MLLHAYATSLSIMANLGSLRLRGPEKSGEDVAKAEPEGRASP